MFPGYVKDMSNNLHFLMVGSCVTTMNTVGSCVTTMNTKNVGSCVNNIHFILCSLFFNNVNTHWKS